MTMIQISNLTFAYYGGEQPIFNRVSFALDTDWKTGLIGRNGIGKTTFFKILMGELPFQGEVITSMEFDHFPFFVEDQRSMGLNIYQKENPLGEEWRIGKELNLLEADENILYRPFNSLSKGEQTKLLLAILFTKDNKFLLIDEPTNHLDAMGRKRVSDYLEKKRGFLLISHDRNFLDRCIDHVVAINRQSIEVQSGNFTSWHENKKRQEQFELAQHHQLRKDVQRLKEASKQRENWANKAEETKKGVKISGIKPDRGYIGHRAAKMMKRAKHLEYRQHRAIGDKQKLLKDVEIAEDLKLHGLFHHKDMLIQLDDVSLFYGEKTIVKQVNLTVNQGDRIAINGKNGSGKSSLLKVILGEDMAYTGKVAMAKALRYSYISQASYDLQGPMDHWIAHHGIEERLFKAILRKLGFSRNLFTMTMDKYSEGQKRKTLIATSLCQEAHVFIWDEPLNYIDIISRIQIEDMILNYRPTLIFVEHDQQFIERVATKTLAL